MGPQTTFPTTSQKNLQSSVIEIKCKRSNLSRTYAHIELKGSIQEPVVWDLGIKKYVKQSWTAKFRTFSKNTAIPFIFVMYLYFLKITFPSERLYFLITLFYFKCIIILAISILVIKRWLLTSESFLKIIKADEILSFTAYPSPRKSSRSKQI